MRQRLAAISLVFALGALLASGAWIRSASAQESGLWEAEMRASLGTAARQSLHDVFSRPRLYWKRGPVFETGRKAMAVHLGYEGQFDAAWYGDMAEAVDVAADARWTSGAIVRRSRVLLEIFFLHDTFIRVRYGHAGFANPIFQDLFLEWSGMTRLPGDWWPVIRVGQVKEAMTIDWMNSAFSTTFLERAMFTTSIVPNRSPGIRIQGVGPSKRVTYQLGGYLVNAAKLSEYREDSGRSVTGRVTCLPWAPAGRPNHLLHVGLSASWRFDVETYKLGSKPESWVGPQIVATGEFAADSSRVLAGEFFYQRDRLSLTAEGGWTRVNQPEGDAIDFWGAYGQVSYFLTPGHIPYNRKLGCYGRVRPKRSIFCPAKPGFGEWELAARYSILDLEDGPFPGGRLWDVTLGLNWYARDNIRVSCNYIYSDVRSAYGVPGADGTMNTLVARLSYDL